MPPGAPLVPAVRARRFERLVCRHPDPTLSEAIGEAHLHLAGKPLHTM